MAGCEDKTCDHFWSIEHCPVLRYFLIAIGILTVFLAAIQLYLTASISFLNFMAPYILLLAIAAGLLIAIAGILVLCVWALFWKLKKTTSRFWIFRGVILLIVGAIIGGAPSAGEFWVQDLQRPGNIKRGDQIVAALKRYYTEHKKYPGSLQELEPRDLPSVPKWKHGLRNYEFKYNLVGFGDEVRSPRLEFYSGLWITIFYNWGAREWDRAPSGS